MMTILTATLPRCPNWSGLKVAIEVADEAVQPELRLAMSNRVKLKTYLYCL